LSGEKLSKANLSGVDLTKTNLSRANLSEANLCRAVLYKANLRKTDLSEADLLLADLSKANLSEANLFRANLSEANLTRAELIRTQLNRSNLKAANLSGARMGWTLFTYVDLRDVRGLNTMRHWGPSSIGIDTIYRSQGQIPEIFLRMAGVPETFLTNMRALVDSMSPIDFYSCFISYSSRDQEFAKRLYADLLSNGVRCWFAPHHMRIGDEIRARIDESIRIHDKLLLVFSKHALASNWVQKEVETAFEKEQNQNQLVLFPIMLDETVMHATQAWAADVRRTRHIGDFTKWKQHNDYQQAFERLLRDLKAEV
jgi:hypothetical protein